MSSKVKKAQEPSLPCSIGVTDINVVETTFKWVVNNFSFYQNGFKSKLSSPVFETTNNKSITWCIDLDPSTSNKFNNLSMNLKLVQSNLPKVHATFEFTIINKDGLPEKSTSTKSATFHKGSSKGSKILMSHGYFEKNLQRILPNDTLTILCKIKANVDQGATNTMQVKDVPKQKSKAQCPSDQAEEVPVVKKQKNQAELNNLTKATAKMDIEDLLKLNPTTAAVASTTKSTTVAANYTLPPNYQPGIASFTNTNIKNSPKPNKTTQAVAVASTTMSTNVAANVYSPMNTAFAACSIPPPSYQPMNTAFAACSIPPPSYQPGIAPFTSTPIQHKSHFGTSGSSAAPPPNSSTPSPYCCYCNYLLHNCVCNCCKYCKFPSQYCKCIHCKICNFRVKECTCIYCEYCGDAIVHCKCEYCFYCESHVEECCCGTCDYCDSHEEECECPYCPDCDFHVNDCCCDDNCCDYCDEPLEFCECDYCPDCDYPIDECECNEYGNNHFYY